jgi:hypothetical protein
MSSREVEALRRFVQRGGWLIADSQTALMDGHCKRLPKGQLDDLFGIERKTTHLSSGSPGLRPVLASGTVTGIDLENLVTAENPVSSSRQQRRRDIRILAARQQSS